MTRRRLNPVHRSLSRPLTILGAERKLFFSAMCIGGATFNLLGSFLGGLSMFLALYLLARQATSADSEMLRLLLRSAKLHRVYDPMKFTPVPAKRAPTC
jgi:type IV secretory pathway TrbD component